MGVTKIGTYRTLVIDLSDNTQVNAGNSNVQTLQPPVNKVYEVLHIFYNIATPGGTAAGTHDITITTTNFAEAIIISKAAHGSTVQIKSLELVGDSLELPTTTPTQAMAIQSLVATYDEPVVFTYNNDTDVNQTKTRTLKILVRVKDLG
jgi:hypothetical protein